MIFFFNSILYAFLKKVNFSDSIVLFVPIFKSSKNNGVMYKPFRHKYPHASFGFFGFNVGSFSKFPFFLIENRVNTFNDPFNDIIPIYSKPSIIKYLVYVDMNELHSL